jgi:hypothetical protein
VKQPDKILVEQGICFSACAYAFLGGVTREIDTKGLFGLHQFRSQRSNKNDKGEASTQIAVALLAQYLDEMGIDRKVLDIASIIPSKDIQILPLHIAQALNVDNTNPPKGKWEIGTSNSGNLFAYIVQKQPRKNALVCFCLARSNQNFIATIVYIIRQNFRSEKYLEDMFNATKSAYITIDRSHTSPLRPNSCRILPLQKYVMLVMSLQWGKQTLYKIRSWKCGGIAPQRMWAAGVNGGCIGWRPLE